MEDNVYTSTKQKGKTRNKVLKHGQRRIVASATVCMRKDDEVRKFKRSAAVEMETKGWKYCPKKALKEHKVVEVVAQAPTEVTEVVVEVKKEKKPRKQKKS